MCMLWMVSIFARLRCGGMVSWTMLRLGVILLLLARAGEDVDVLPVVAAVVFVVMVMAVVLRAKRRRQLGRRVLRLLQLRRLVL